MDEIDIHALKERVALLSIVASAGLALGKFVAGILSGSLGLLSFTIDPRIAPLAVQAPCVGLCAVIHLHKIPSHYVKGWV